MDEVIKSAADRFREETFSKYRDLCDAVQLLDRRFGPHGFDGAWVGPSMEERAEAQTSKDRLSKEVFEDVMTLFREVGGQQALELFNEMIESSRPRETEDGHRFTPPFNRDYGFLTQVLVAVTEKGVASDEKVEGQRAEVIDMVKKA